MRPYISGAVVNQHEEAQLTLWGQCCFRFVKEKQSIPAKFEIEQREERFPMRPCVKAATAVIGAVCSDLELRVALGSARTCRSLMRRRLSGRKRALRYAVFLEERCGKLSRSAPFPRPNSKLSTGFAKFLHQHREKTAFQRAVFPDVVS